MDALVDTLDEFAGKIQARISAAETAPKWSGADVQRYMDEFLPRREQFERLAAHLVTDVIRPRLLRLGSFFGEPA